MFNNNILHWVISYLMRLPCKYSAYQYKHLGLFYYVDIFCASFIYVMQFFPTFESLQHFSYGSINFRTINMKANAVF